VHVTYVQILDVCITYGDGDKNYATRLKLVQKKWKKIKNGKKKRNEKRKKKHLAGARMPREEPELLAQNQSIRGQKREKKRETHAVKRSD
jgi:hypothetical protein